MIFQGSGWLVTLTGVRVTGNCMLIAYVTYQGQRSPVPMTCDGLTNPAIDTLAIGGNKIAATVTNCSENPEETWSGGINQGFAVFPVSHLSNLPMTLKWQWQSRVRAAGIVRNITIP